MKKENDDSLFLSRGCSCSPKLKQNYKHGCNKMDVYSWLNDIDLPKGQTLFNFVEVRFKNSRKDFFRNVDKLHLSIGDIVAVESSPGHEIGIITMVGELVLLQMKKKNIAPSSEEIKKIYRKARSTDIEKWISAISLEATTMFKAREIVEELNLDMKINDVEYQGDKTKVIFYYTADERVDFRELIKILAEKFMVRIEMRQIGVRQEASRLGGIGSCGRELCCSTWISSFKSVSTNAARQQQLSLNPQKLAGQCNKLKCCLNYEYDWYADALEKFPSSNIILKTKNGEGIYQKTDIVKNIVWYSYSNNISDVFAIPADKVKEIIELNKKGTIPEKLEDFANVKEKKDEFWNFEEEDDLTRFDDK